jgi:predicted RNA-binding protein YlxR (DUF448 family)
MKHPTNNDRLSPAANRRSFLKGIAGSAAMLPILPAFARSGSTDEHTRVSEEDVALDSANESYGRLDKPVEVQGSSVRLYLEGLMIFALNKEQKRLEAGILNVDDGHNLRLRTFSRKSANNGGYSDEGWEKVKAESIPNTELQRYGQGEVTILSPGGESKNIATPIVPGNREIWTPFDLIPDIEEIVGSRVRLDRSKVKPVLSITGGKFYSVIRPDHVEDAKPPDRRVERRGFIPTYLVEKDQVMMAKAKACGKIESLEDLVKLGVAVNDLSVRSYTAATMITLNKGEELVCVLKGERGEQRELFRVKYAPNREAKVVLENAVNQYGKGSPVHSHIGEKKSDLKHIFHFLHFYEAMKVMNEKRQVLLASEDMLVNFVNSEMGTPLPPQCGNALFQGNVQFPSVLASPLMPRLSGVRRPIFTGADNPLCPSGRKSGGLFT